MIIGVTHKICGLCGERLIIKIMHNRDYRRSDGQIEEDDGAWYLGYECLTDGPYGRVSIHFRHKCLASEYLHDLLERGDTSKLRRPEYLEKEY